MKRFIIAAFALALLALPGFSFAQSSPGLVYGQVPTAAQWNAYFSGKQDYATGQVRGPSSATLGDSVCWGTFPAVTDCGLPTSVVAGTNITVSRSGNAYTVNSTASAAGANPTASVGSSPINGVATTFMRSDAAPALASAAANTVLANTTGGSAVPTANALPSCVDGSNRHLNYTSGTGFSCGSLLPVLRSYLAGCTLSTAGSSATFGVSACTAADTATTAMMVQNSAYTKTTGAWAVGTGNGCLDTGTIAINTWYHVYEIERLDTGVVDYICSTSASAPSYPTNYTISRRLGSMKTNGSSQWIQFFQNGDEVLWTTAVNDYTAQGVGNVTPVTLTLSVPPGVRTVAIFNFAYNNTQGSNSYVTFGSVDQAAPTSSVTNGWAGPFNSATLGGQWLGAAQIQTNLSAQIYTISSTTTGAVWIYTQGYIDRRGRDN